MNRTKFLAAGLLGLGLAAFAQGQTTEPEKVTLTVDQAVDYALQHSRTLKSAQIDLEMKDRAAKYGWNVLLPSLDVRGTMSRSNEYNPSNMLMNPTKSNFDDEEERWNAVGVVSFGWNFSAAMIPQIRASKAAFEGGKISWEQSQIDTTMQIRKFFYGLLLQQENLKIQQTTLENSRQRASQAQTNYRNGIVPEISYLQAEVTYQNLINDMDQKELELAQSFYMLGLLI